MKQGQQKAKGNSFENKVAKELSLWISNGTRVDIFDRSPASGAKATLNFTKRNSENFANQTGDVIALEDIGYTVTNKFVIECKHYANLQFTSLLFGSPKNGLLAFWQKLLTECNRVGKAPILVGRQNFKPGIVCLSEYGVTTFAMQKYIAGIYPKLGMYVLLWDEFLTNASKSLINELHH